jgi:hypothetical protein
VKKWRPIVADAEGGHAVVFGAVVAGGKARLKGVVYGAAAVGAGKEVRRKDAGTAPQPAEPSHCTLSHKFLTVSPLAPLFTNLLEGALREVHIQHPAYRRSHRARITLYRPPVLDRGSLHVVVLDVYALL